MPTYFIRTRGDDSNDGLTPETAWRTFGKALGAAGISSGDTVYVGAGVYREVVAVGMTSATTETKIIGDIDGYWTGDEGEIQWTSYIKNDETLPQATVNLNLNGKDFLSFSKITFVQGSSSAIITATTQTSTDIKFNNCIFYQCGSASTSLNVTAGFGVLGNWIIDSCIFWGNHSGGASITITLTTGVGSDYNFNFLIQNCLFLGTPNAHMIITSSGTSANEGGGVYIYNCSFLGTGSSQIITTTLRVGGSTFLYPVVVYNCLFMGRISTAINASELGNIIENYNVISSANPRANTAIGKQSVSDLSVAPLLNLRNLFNNKVFIPSKDSPLLGHGDRTVAPLIDFFNNTRPKDNINLIHEGYITQITGNVIADTTKTFGWNTLNGYNIKIPTGVAANNTLTINANTNTIISGDGSWPVVPNVGEKYYVYSGPTALTSIVSSGSGLTLTDDYAKWGSNFWQGYTLEVISGVGSGQKNVVSGNSSTVLSGYSGWQVIPNTGDIYHLYWGVNDVISGQSGIPWTGYAASGINYLHCAVGYGEKFDSIVKDSSVGYTNQGSARFFGPGVQNFYVPVDNTQTIVSVYCKYDNLYSGIKPQIQLIDSSGLGIPDQLVTMTANPETWQQLQMIFTPSGTGVATIQVLSNTTGTFGKTWFSDFSFS